jgi:hypothetical protein
MMKMKSEECHSLYNSQYIIRIVKSRSIRWRRHAEYTGFVEKFMENFIQETCREGISWKT